MKYRRNYDDNGGGDGNVNSDDSENDELKVGIINLTTVSDSSENDNMEDSDNDGNNDKRNLNSS